jgi:hypothetical protein
VSQLQTILLYILLIVAGTVAVNAIVRFVWRVRSALRLRKNTKSPAGVPLIWRDPGKIEELDLFHGPGGKNGVPQPPFHFIEEHSTGSSPSISIRDDRSRIWRVKWGDEVNTENFCTRIAWACGYFVETTYFLKEGKIEDVHDELKRAQKCLDAECNFKDARFELDDPSMKKHFEEKSWAWNDNPFFGSRELNGLKILFMLFSNWDNKDQRDVARGSNTAIFQHKNELRYLIIDWGAAMGKWGTNLVTRGKWDCPGFQSQNETFLKIQPDGSLVWGYLGQRTEDISAGIEREDVRWFCRYAGRISNDQILQALLASGATDEEAECFIRAIRERLDQLKQV